MLLFPLEIKEISPNNPFQIESLTTTLGAGFKPLIAGSAQPGQLLLAPVCFLE